MKTESVKSAAKDIAEFFDNTRAMGVAGAGEIEHVEKIILAAIEMTQIETRARIKKAMELIHPSDASEGNHERGMMILSELIGHPIKPLNIRPTTLADLAKAP